MSCKITRKIIHKGIYTLAPNLIKQTRKFIIIFSSVFSSFSIAVGVSAADIIPPRATNSLVLAQGQLLNPKFAGFDMQPQGCDVREINGWFYWYRHDLNRCTVVLAGNQADATFKAVELADSTNVIEAGIGYRLIGDPIF